jgi:cation transporter-like permease
VGGAALVMLVRALAVALRITGTIVRQFARVLVTVYDILIVVPLLVERLVINGRGGSASKPLRKPAGVDLGVGERS